MTGIPLPDAHEVHRFWFGDHPSWAECVAANHERWFRRGHELDGPVSEHFSGLVESAARGDLDTWRDTPGGALALVLALDQFPRHIWRGRPEAFATDAAARDHCRHCIGRGLDRALSPVERTFLYLPLEHAEDPGAQEQCVALMRGMHEEAPEALGAYLAETLRYAELHRDIIARFGRFPHRNAILGRSTTAEEAAWLEEGGARFGQ